jgi:hypothetical protein
MVICVQASLSPQITIDKTTCTIKLSGVGFLNKVRLYLLILYCFAVAADGEKGRKGAGGDGVMG